MAFSLQLQLSTTDTHLHGAKEREIRKAVNNVIGTSSNLIKTFEFAYEKRLQCDCNVDNLTIYYSTIDNHPWGAEIVKTVGTLLGAVDTDRVDEDTTRYIINLSRDSESNHYFMLVFKRKPKGMSQWASWYHGVRGGYKTYSKLLTPYNLELTEEGSFYILELAPGKVEKVKIHNAPHGYHSPYISDTFLPYYAHDSGSLNYTPRSMYMAIISFRLFTRKAFGFNENGEFEGNRESITDSFHRNFIEWATSDENAIRIIKAAVDEPTSYQKAFVTQSLSSDKDLTETINRLKLNYKTTYLIESRLTSEMISKVIGSTDEVNIFEFLKQYKASFRSNGDFQKEVMRSNSMTLEAKLRKFYDELEGVNLR